jgi:hypothetical protein
MLNWMNIASGVLQLGGNIAANAIQRKRERKKVRELKRMRQENKQWYDQRYNEDATQRADAQALLNNTLQVIRERNRAAAGKQAVMGGTDEAVAAEKQSGNDLLAKTTSNIAADAANRKDEIEEQYRNRDAELQGQISDVRDARSQRIANSVVGYANTAASMLGGSDAFIQQ